MEDNNMKTKGWRHESERHALCARGIKTEIKETKNIRYKEFMKEQLKFEINYIISLGAMETLSYQLVTVRTLNNLYYEFKNNKEKYNIKEVKTLITPSASLGTAKFYVKWNNGNITIIKGFMVIEPFQYISDRKHA
jgi:hypothetical protein